MYDNDLYSFIVRYYYQNWNPSLSLQIESDKSGLNQNLTKKVMLLYKDIVQIRCCKWISLQRAEYNQLLIRQLCNQRIRSYLAQEANDSTFQRTWKSWYDYYKRTVAWQSVNKIQATLQMTSQAVKRFYQKWSVKII